MSRDCLAGRIEKMTALTNHMGHHTAFADRVEKHVCYVCGVTSTSLRVRSRLRRLSHARFLLFSILYQRGKGYDRRSQGWLARRYNTDPWSVQHGLKKVKEDLELQRKEITIMALMERELELELFGPRRGTEDDTHVSEEPRGCDTLL